jgi:DNA-binding transcriptional ArsR family regulator
LTSSWAWSLSGVSRLARPYRDQSYSDQLTTSFAALADPTRRAILKRLASGEASVMELAKPFNMSQPAVSKHLKVLERARLISRSREAQFRPCRLEAGRLKEVAEWVEQYRRLWEESFEQLDEYLEEMKSKKRRRAMIETSSALAEMPAVGCGSCIGSSRQSKALVWTGRVVSALPVAMMPASAGMKLAHTPQLTELWHAKLGFYERALMPVGLLELTWWSST